MAPADHSIYTTKRSSRRKRSEIGKLLERMHIRLALAAFKAQYGYETCALDTLESKFIRHSPLSPYSDNNRPAKPSSDFRRYPQSPTSSNQRKIPSSLGRPNRKLYNEDVIQTWSSSAPASRTRTSPQRYYRHGEIHPKPKTAAAAAYLTPTSPLFHTHPSITADESAKRTTTPNHHHSLTPPRSLSPALITTLHRSSRNQSPTPQKPSSDMNGSLWDQCGLASQPSVDETHAAKLLMGLWYAR